MDANYMSTDRWMDKEIVVHVYNGILLNHNKESVWVSSTEMDEPRAHEVRKKSHILMHIHGI